MIFSKRSLIVTSIIFGSSLILYLYNRNKEDNDEVFVKNGRIKLYKHIELVFQRFKEINLNLIKMFKELIIKTSAIIGTSSLFLLNFFLDSKNGKKSYEEQCDYIDIV